LVAGKSLSDSVFAMEELEESAKLNFLLRGHPVNLLSDAQIAELQSLSLKV
jgi:ribulose-5-phosphate 4-epimerase/fuculose-1-phosphate aldolase